MHKLLLFLVFFTAFRGWSQHTWKESWHVPIGPDCTWDADQAGNVYLFCEQSISKIDSTGKQLLTQSTKSIGTISKIDATNWLKIAIFSEEQQQICYLDNALGLQPGCIDLTELGVTLAQQFTTSAQTDRLWVYDQLNSELQLITVRSNQRQIVQNLKSLVDLGNVLQLVEFGNTLYLLDDKGQVTTFDNFGTFTGSTAISATHIQPFDTGLLSSSGGTILFTSKNEEQSAVFFGLPENGPEIQQFSFTGKLLYLSTKDGLYCFKPID
jgi:hypothetical protein